MPKPHVDELERFLASWEARNKLRERQQADIKAECVARIAANEEAIYRLPFGRTGLLFGLYVVGILAAFATGYVLLG
ncbi:hypothetical protein A7J71_11260 [Achromobacter insolitus]|uniref:hypothetical protein n=1 Tax=Achromobacter insolitus TaxID=217204 RepID=UPI0007CFB7E0|nr:hypothetical protein [Achromobacter insolitus]OAE72590.1 hypothetical protein A7J71_11260 [Achromobacter insolitus]